MKKFKYELMMFIRQGPRNNKVTCLGTCIAQTLADAVFQLQEMSPVKLRYDGYHKNGDMVLAVGSCGEA